MVLDKYQITFDKQVLDIDITEQDKGKNKTNLVIKTSHESYLLPS